MTATATTTASAQQPAADATSDQPWRNLRITVRDGLSLYGRHYPAPDSKRRPVLCLAGLTRNSRDFHVLASRLSGSGPDARSIFTMDCRGRGGSNSAADWKDYAIPIEMLDVQDFMAAQQLHDAGIIGTSRGGLITMVLGAAQPTLIGPVVLNDIGPVIDHEGLIRISGYVGRTPLPASWEDAKHLVAGAERARFPNVSDEEWAEVARERFNEVDGKPAPGYDPNIAKSFSIKDGAVPELWPQFEALKRKPLLVIRGANSDLLSEETVGEMLRRHPRASSYTVEAQGHAPLLRDTPAIAAIARFFAQYDDAP
jgi:pimeloyl-ACP methyl ester carboxylesterase